MKEAIIVVVVADIDQFDELHTALMDEPYRIIKGESCSDIETLISEPGSNIVIVDLDSVPVDNRFLKKLKTSNPGLSILALSSKKFHPELREAISSYIYACLNKPLDPEELRFWLKSIILDGPVRGPSP